MSRELILKRAGLEEAELIWNMQKIAFADLLERYQDVELNPANEPIDKIIMRLNQKFTYYYLLESEGEIVGAIRVVDKKEEGKRKRISPLFILPKYWNQGLAQQAMLAVEEIHGRTDWELDTILQEKGNCYLYEKMGYRATGKTEQVNEKMTLVFYEK